MMRIDKILVPTDFSTSSDHAVTHALYLAHVYGAELHLLHIIALHEDDPHNPSNKFPDDDALRSKLEGFISRHEDETKPASDITILREERRDVSAAPAIVEYAEEKDIDLVVMGTHGRRGVRHLLVGSVTEEVVRLAPCAVLSVRTESDPKPLSGVRNLLAPVDFSQHSRGALVVARDLAGSYGARLHLLHVWENVLHPAFYNMGAMSIKDLQPEIEDRTMRALEELLEETPGAEVQAEFHAIEGHAARDIVDFAARNGSDLIVIATHGLTGVEHFLLGSVAEKVVRRAPCPVLVVKRQKSLVA